MSITSLLFSGKGAFDSLAFDATVTEQHTSDAEITDHPVETGANISDHVRSKPDRLQMDAFLSNSPLTGTAEPGRAENLYEQLRLLKESATLLTVLTTLRTYENMAIESLGVPRTAKEAGAVHINITLRQIRLVTNKTSVVTVTKEPIAKSKASGGKQAATQLSDSDAAARDKTLAKAGLDAVVSFFGSN